MHTAAITRKATRRKNETYFTPTSAVELLLTEHDISGSILEPCCGEGAISNFLSSQGYPVTPTDISVNPDDDATSDRYWERHGKFDWIVSNPPFSLATFILQHSYKNANIGVAFILRLSYLEPCQDRGAWLQEHPPSNLIVMPRISFTGDGKVDSCTTAWMVWDKRQPNTNIKVRPRKEN